MTPAISIAFDRLQRASRMVVGPLLLSLVFAAPSHAGVVIPSPLEKCARSVDKGAQRQWEETNKSMADLVTTGLFEVRAAYRMKLCKIEFTVYVLQNTT